MLPDNGDFERSPASQTGRSKGGIIPINSANRSDLVVSNKMQSAAWSQSDVIRDFAQIALDSLPNDLTRMLYLGSLRDCNSGRYFDPQLSNKLGVETAHQVLCSYHDQVFRRLLSAAVSDYVDQLEEYIRYAKAERNNFLKTWQRLEAYRATVPVTAVSLYREAFCLNIELALMILTTPGSDGRAQDAASRFR